MLLTLRYLADGGRLHLVGDAHGVDKSTMSRVIQRVTTVINEQLFSTVVNWPNEPGSIANISARFRLLAGMPFVIGCIDGTHVPIVGPHENEPQFVNRHGTHSINCMAVAGPDFKFYYVSCKWPGSVADARVYRNSTLAARLENWRPIANAIILAESGYGLSEVIMTPVQNPINQPQQNYNRAHKRTRVIVEQAFGVLKARFGCLEYLRLQPRACCRVIKTCFILHNYIIMNQVSILNIFLFHKNNMPKYSTISISTFYYYDWESKFAK